MSVWKGGVWASQKGINAVGPWKGSLWRSERSLTSLGIKKLLFGQGQQGIMYVPQPTVDGQQVLYQDSAGTTPVTADGQSVGLMLDLSKGLKLGPELVTNGGFDSGLDGWTAGGSDGNSIELSNSMLKVISGGVQFGWAYTALDTTVGEEYVLNSELVSTQQSGRLLLRNDVANTSVGAIRLLTGLAVGAHSAVFTATATTTYLLIYVESTAASAFVVYDNISVRELLGQHASQTTASKKALYSTTPPLQDYDAVDDEMIVSLPAIASATVATATPIGTVINYPVDLSTGSYTINSDHSGIIIREGELTASEQQSVTDYLDNLAGV